MNQDHDSSTVPTQWLLHRHNHHRWNKAVTDPRFHYQGWTKTATAAPSPPPQTDQDCYFSTVYSTRDGPKSWLSRRLHYHRLRKAVSPPPVSTWRGLRPLLWLLYNTAKESCYSSQHLISAFDWAFRDVLTHCVSYSVALRTFILLTFWRILCYTDYVCLHIF